MGTDVGLRFKSNRGRGGLVENIYISNINMINIPNEALIFNLYYGGKGRGEDPNQDEKKAETTIPPVTEETPIFRNIFIKDTNFPYTAPPTIKSTSPIINVVIK